MSILERFRREVMECGIDAALPRSLSDEWLLAVTRAADHLAFKLEEYRDPSTWSEDAEEYSAMALVAIFSLLWAKAPAVQPAVEVSVTEIRRYLADYRLELALEMAHRNAEIHYEAASVQSIFTNRNVKTRKDSRPTR